MQERISSSTTSDGYRMTIAVKKHWPFVIFWGLWVVIWFLGIVTFGVAMSESSQDRPPIPLAMLMLFGMAVVGGGVLCLWLWQTFGKEVVTVANGSVSLGKNVLGFSGFARTRRFDIAQVQNLRASGLFGSFQNWSGMLKFYGINGGVVAFESGGKTYRFGIQLEEDEARQVVQDLLPHLR
jgi:hypothetical protein